MAMGDVCWRGLGRDQQFQSVYVMLVGEAIAAPSRYVRLAMTHSQLGSHMIFSSYGVIWPPMQWFL
jgi:hypothetical protein